jgi:hypothetical protein
MHKKSRLVTDRIAFSVVVLAIGAAPRVAVGVPGPTGSAEFSFVRPSARRSLTLCYALPSSAAVRLAIYDGSGRQVRELMSGIQPAGTHQVAWDLSDESGQPVPDGIHFAQLEAEVRTLTAQLMTIR